MISHLQYAGGTARDCEPIRQSGRRGSSASDGLAAEPIQTCQCIGLGRYQRSRAKADQANRQHGAFGIAEIGLGVAGEVSLVLALLAYWVFGARLFKGRDDAQKLTPPNC